MNDQDGPSSSCLSSEAEDPDPCPGKRLGRLVVGARP